MQRMTFQLPSELHASIPPEQRGAGRGDVRMMVLYENGSVDHKDFKDIGKYFVKGDVLILNNSRTLPAELEGAADNEKVRFRLSRRLNESDWEVLYSKGHAAVGQTIQISNELTALVLKEDGPFVHLSFSRYGAELFNELYSSGQPIRYEYIQYPWELDYYQTVYGTVPGSVEMTSAGRAISWELIFALKAMGVKIGYVTLHTGLSDLLQEDWSPDPSNHFETYHIPEETARMLNEAKREGRRVIAVGTTVVRAIETAFDTDIKAGGGLTNLYINSRSKLNVINGLLTGFHEPEASHLDMLTAFVSESKLKSAYNDAVERMYLWHEFGDVNLILKGSKK